MPKFGHHVEALTNGPRVEIYFYFFFHCRLLDDCVPQKCMSDSKIGFLMNDRLTFLIIYSNSMLFLTFFQSSGVAPGSRSDRTGSYVGDDQYMAYPSSQGLDEPRSSSMYVVICFLFF